MANHFGTVDYFVCILILLFSASVGVYYRMTGGRQKTTKEYLLADKDMSVIPVGFSLMASFMSAITLLGVPSENYIYGTQFVMINFSYIFGTFLSAFLYLPVFFKLQTTSAYQYLQLRFGRITRVIASISFILQMTLYMSIVLYAPALALNAVTGLSKWMSILSVGFVCTFYSTIGGMKAVLWTDLFQSLLMFAAIFAVIFRGLMDTDIGTVWEIANNGSRIEFFNFSPDPTVRHTFWTQMIGGIFTYTSIYGVNQAQVQRLLTVRNLRRSQIALFLNWPIVTALSLITSFSGIVVYSKYYTCDPLKSKRIDAKDQLLPLFVMDFLSHVPGLAGLFVSGIFSAALSTVSSAVNSLAAVTVEDLIRPYLRVTERTDRMLALFSKSLAFGFGLICILLVYVVEQLGGVLQASLTIFGIVGGPLLGLFSLGMFFARANEKGAVVGYLFGVTVSCWIGFGAMHHKVYYPELPKSVEGCLPENFTAVDNSDNINIISSSFSDFSLLNTLSIGEFNTNSSTLNITPTLSIGEFDGNSSMLSNKAEQIDPAERNKDILYPYRISYMWYAPIGFFSVIIAGMVVSCLTEKQLNLDPDLLSPPFAKFAKRNAKNAVKGNAYFTSLEMLPENGVLSSVPNIPSDLESEECRTKL